MEKTNGNNPFCTLGIFGFSFIEWISHSMSYYEEIYMREGGQHVTAKWLCCAFILSCKWLRKT